MLLPHCIPAVSQVLGEDRMYDQYLSHYIITNNVDPQKFLLHKGIELARRMLSKILYVVDVTDTAG